MLCLLFSGTGGADQEAPIMVTEGSMKSTEEKRAASSRRRTLARAGRAEEEADRVEQAHLEVNELKSISPLDC